MVAFPGCKINLGLYVTGKRADGYHNIETCFYHVPWSDAVEIVPSGSFRLHIPGSSLEPDEQNTCTKAFRLLESRFGIPPVEAWLLKSVPHGAGLGGGSADGAAMLGLLNAQFDLGLQPEQLEETALSLGSDCPFFIRPTPKLATGKGERFQPVDLSLKGYHIRIVKTPASISTAEAYRHVRIGTAAHDLRTTLEGPIDEWRHRLENVFEPYAFAQIPELPVIIRSMYDEGAVFAGMTGSGSAVFGLYDQEPPQRRYHPDYVVWSGELA